MIKKGDKVRIIATGRVGRVIEKWWSWFVPRYTVELYDDRTATYYSYMYTDDEIELI